MRIQTILNRVEKFKSFVYGEAEFEERNDGPAIVFQIEPRKHSRVFCSGCGRHRPELQVVLTPDSAFMSNAVRVSYRFNI